MTFQDLVSVEIAVTERYIAISYSAFEHGSVLIFNAAELRAGGAFGAPQPVAKFTKREQALEWLEKNK